METVRSISSRGQETGENRASLLQLNLLIKLAHSAMLRVSARRDGSIPASKSLASVSLAGRFKPAEREFLKVLRFCPKPACASLKN